MKYAVELPVKGRKTPSARFGNLVAALVLKLKARAVRGQVMNPVTTDPPESWRLKYMTSLSTKYV